MNENLKKGEEREIKDRIDVRIYDQYRVDKAKLFDMDA